MEQKIPCPSCGELIRIEVSSLIKGNKFFCSFCKTQIGLSDESKNTTDDAIKTLEEIKKRIQSE